MGTCLLLALLLADAPLEQWNQKLQTATAALQAQPTVASYTTALEAAYRADAWQEALRLAEQAHNKFASSQELKPYLARAFWRAGRIALAEQIAAQIQEPANDSVALQVLLAVSLSQNKLEEVSRYAEQLSKAPNLRGADYAALAGAALATRKMDGLPDLIRKTLRHSKVEDGYPEQFIEENLDGLAEYLEAIGPRPLNHVTAFGSAPMPVSTINLPICEVWINGKGPFRMIVDTGGSVMLSLDQSVADALKLPKHQEAIIRGVGGTSQSTQSLIDDLQIGQIRMQRVMTRVFDVSKSILFSADGILGTGVFSEARMTMDFENGKLIVEQSSSKAAPGAEIPLRRIGDEKLITILRVGDRAGTGLFDTGADAVALSQSTLKELHPDLEIANLEVGALGVGSGAATNLSMGPGVRLELAGRKYPSISGIGLGVLDEVLSPMLGMHQDVLIGMPVFRECSSLTVDFPACRMWLDWLAE